MAAAGGRVKTGASQTKAGDGAVAGDDPRIIESAGDEAYVNNVGRSRRDRRETALSIEARREADIIPLPSAARRQRLDADDAARTILHSLETMKAEDIVEIDLTGKSALADRMIIASGRVNRHVGAIAEKVIADLREHGAPLPRVEGMPVNDWVLIDTGDVIVHVFRPEVRAFYNLEKMWSLARPGELRPS